jgi:hypothetical protein
VEEQTTMYTDEGAAIEDAKARLRAMRAPKR